MSKSFHLRKDFAPKISARLPDEPAVVKSLSWLTQLNTLAATAQPDDESIVVIVGGKQKKGYINRTNIANVEGTTLDVSLDDGRRYRLMADGTLYIRTINGSALPEENYTVELFSLGSELDVPMSFTVKKVPLGGWAPLGNLFGSSFGGSRKYTDYQTVWVPADLEHKAKVSRFDIVKGTEVAYQSSATAINEYVHRTEGPECLYGDNSPEAKAYVWHTAIVNSVITVRRQTGDISPSLSLVDITSSLRVPEGTRRVSCTFTYYGVPVFVYETPQGFKATYLYKTGLKETINLPANTMNAYAWPVKPDGYIPETAEDYSKLYIGVFSNE